LTTSARDFYRIARNDDKILDRLSGIQDEAVFIGTIEDIARERGITLTSEEIRQAIFNLTEIVQSVANDDELTDFELEMIAAGVPVNCERETIKA
tara:strand:- start:37 stop:321 length:285 start_codon:yes stop_codon:yes gene_type:complete